MFVKVYKEGRKHAYYPCQHIDVEERTEDREFDGVKYKAGITIQVCGVGSDGKGIVNVEMPKDGDVAYIENDHGDTIGTYRWPTLKDRTSANATSAANASSNPTTQETPV